MGLGDWLLFTHSYLTLIEDKADKVTITYNNKESKLLLKLHNIKPVY